MCFLANFFGYLSHQLLREVCKVFFFFFLNHGYAFVYFFMSIFASFVWWSGIRYKHFMSFWWIILFCHCEIVLISRHIPCLKVCFISYCYSHTSFLMLITICMVYLFSILLLPAYLCLCLKLSLMNSIQLSFGFVSRLKTYLDCLVIYI